MTDDEPGGGRASGDETGSGGSGDEVAAAGGGAEPTDGAPDVVLELPDDVREEFREPLGPVHADADALLAGAGDPVLAVGDVVTYHLARAGRPPDVAVVDWRTEREAVDDAVGRVVGDLGGTRRRVSVDNPPATLTADLLAALHEAVARATATDSEPTVVEVTGEEDLATLPAVLAAPDGASVVYGQPGEGMVLVAVDDAVRERVRGLFGTLAGDHDRARRLLGVEG